MLNTVAFLGQVVPTAASSCAAAHRGTPIGPFFGVEPPTGRSFDIMSIDIVTLEDGKIVLIHHLEDRTSAIAQLTASE